MAERSEVRAGLFVLLALTILILGTLWITGFSPFAGRKTVYEVAMKGSAGVRAGDRIRVAGIEVGRVKEVVLRAGEEWPVIFRVALDEAVALTAGTTARITTDGLLGAPYLEIVPGPAGAPRLPPGSRIRGLPAASLTDALAGLGEATERLPALLDEAAGLAGTLGREIEPLLVSLQELLSSQNVEAISATLAALRPALAEAGPRLSSLLGRLDALAARLEEGADQVPEVAAEVTGLSGDLRRAIGPDGERLATLLDAAQGTLGSASGALETVGDHGTELEAMLRDLRDAAANLKSLTQTLKERPGLLLRYPRPPEGRAGEGPER